MCRRMFRKPLIIGWKDLAWKVPGHSEMNREACAEWSLSVIECRAGHKTGLHWFGALDAWIKDGKGFKMCRA